MLRNEITVVKKTRTRPCVAVGKKLTSSEGGSTWSWGSCVMAFETRGRGEWTNSCVFIGSSRHKIFVLDWMHVSSALRRSKWNECGSWMAASRARFLLVELLCVILESECSHSRGWFTLSWVSLPRLNKRHCTALHLVLSRASTDVPLSDLTLDLALVLH